VKDAAIAHEVEFSPVVPTVCPPSFAPTLVDVPAFQLLHAANGVAGHAAEATPIPAKPSTATASAFIVNDFIEFLPIDWVRA
jgi:hypothetical protein